MADDLKRKSDLAGKGQEVDNIVVSLSQALLAPLDALFKAQVHASRSFLNLVMQLGYPGEPKKDANGKPLPGQPDPDKPIMLNFTYTAPDPVSNVSREYCVNVPQLALVPLNTLNIDSAEFKLGLSVSHVDDHVQNQESRGDERKRPWFLVSNPISMKGTISSHSDSMKNSDSSTTNVDISVTLKSAAVPAALDNLLTALTKSAHITQK